MHGLEALLEPKDLKQDSKLSDFESKAFIPDYTQSKAENEIEINSSNLTVNLSGFVNNRDKDVDTTVFADNKDTAVDNSSFTNIGGRAADVRDLTVDSEDLTVDSRDMLLAQSVTGLMKK